MIVSELVATLAALPRDTAPVTVGLGSFSGFIAAVEPRGVLRLLVDDAPARHVQACPSVGAVLDALAAQDQGAPIDCRLALVQ